MSAIQTRHCYLDWGLQLTMDRWRMVFALIFAVMVAFITSVVAVEIQSGTWQAAFAVSGTAVVGLTYIVLIFGVQINELHVNRDGVQIDFTDDNDDG